ncbi:MAG: peptide chain release factor N(5)-glutamine methyltransferase [Thermodesulfovibrionales bacterium]|nr:peptide chain release factor N(5)-glutamine methyltransferase [Thermodesulfovibrionales bacterium]
MTAIDKLKEVSAFLESKGIEDAAKEAEMLIIETLHIDKSKLYVGSLEITEEASKQIDALTSRRAQGEPIQYIIGHVDFYGLRISVGRGVLIPRPETELLVEETIKELKKRFTVHGSQVTVLDLCTGSGCIAIALAKHFPDADVYGIDKSDTAIQYAIRNASENNIKNIHFIRGDLFEPVKQIKFTCIISNPPYIRKGDIRDLQREIKDYEPIEALDGGEDGLDFYRRILKDAPKYLKKEGIVLLEIGYDQADDVRKIASEAGFKDISFRKDYAGIKRIFVGKQN